MTPKGTAQLNLYHEEWKLYSRKIQELFEGGAANMNRIEFMTELASLLQDIPAEERRDAMQYL